MSTLSPKISKSDKTKILIMDTYLNLIRKMYWEKITVKEIYSHANITRGTFYQYFSSIYDLMEQIQEPLLNTLKSDYQGCPQKATAVITPNTFLEKFDCSPPEPLLVWFRFCMKHKNQMEVLLSANGDPYFLIKLKTLLSEHINAMMDADGMPHDQLREPFIKALIELHFLSVKAWLGSNNSDFLSIDEIINLINTMRVGANYLSILGTKK